MSSGKKYAICSGCFRDRVMRAGALLPHNRWSTAKKAMVLCTGSGSPPATRQQLLRIGFKRVYR